MAELASVGTQEGLLDRMRTRAELYDLVDYASWTDAEERYVTDI
ncbi:MAG: methylisocitrate lyase, partial [Actinomycetia bacterium]|nr:methylisocitrate lyase [Actinomycetes bacterium]